MKKNIFTAALLLSCTAAFTQTDCSKNTDACEAGAKKLSPFVQASMRESVPPHIESAVRKATAPALSASTAAASLQAGTPAEQGGRLSSPAWLLLVLAGFTGLYFYLRGETKKRKKK